MIATCPGCGAGGFAVAAFAVELGVVIAVVVVAEDGAVR
jgi:hypothetical protein